MVLWLIPRNLRERVSKNRPLLWVIYFWMALFAGFAALAAFHKFCEGSSWEVAIWMAWETLSTVGYGDHPAKSTAGRIMTMFIGTMNIIIMSGVIGGVVALTEHYRDKRRSGFMKNPYKNHYLIVNFPGIQHMLAYIREIRAVEPEVAICIVDSNLDRLPSEIEDLGNIHFTKGSMLDTEIHDRVRLAVSKAVIIFPKDSQDVESDGITKVITDLVLKKVSDRIKVMHVLLDSRNSYLFEGLRSVQILDYLEVLSIVQECQDSNTAVIVERLLKNTEGASPKTVTMKQVAGMTWHELQVRCADVAKDLGLNINLFALIQNNQVKLCPNQNEIIQIGDQLSIIVFNGFDWNAFESAMCS